MRHIVTCVAVALTFGLFAATVAADEVGTAIDLSSFNAMQPASTAAAEGSDLSIMPFADAFQASSRRFYLTGIVGASFATLVQPDLQAAPAIGNQTLFTAGGAAGVAFDRPGGWLRMEFEGRGRDRMQISDSDAAVGTLSLNASDGWSSMANVWRDFSVTERFGLYAGAGIGAGGYRCSFDGTGPGGAVVSGSTGITSFAWQGGGGVVYALTNRVTLDLGYRFFALNAGDANIYVTTAVGTVSDKINTAFSASELLLSVRIYEPFRNWR
jgi:opacity protein-like surface antigen